MVRHTRRRLLAAIGAGTTVAIAGCTGGGGGDPVQQDLDPDDWADVSSIELDGYTGNWIGTAPSLVEGVRNPTLLLFAGNEYDITWTNRDGSSHNIAIRDEDRSVVDGHRTDLLRERGESQTITVKATAEMHEYVCEPHPHSMLGYIRVE